MKTYFFTPGPTQLFPTVKKHIQEALKTNVLLISHRSEEFKLIFKNTTNNLKKLLNIPKNYQIFFLSSATEAMERIIENCVEKESFHFVNGAFAKKFFEIAYQLKKMPKKIEVENGKGFDFEAVKIPQTIELICFTQNETSTGVALNPEKFYQFKKVFPNKLIAVDIVSSAPYINLDFNFLDLVFFRCKKGLVYLPDLEC